MTWVILSLAAAVAVGMVGRVYLTTPLEGTASETVFLVMTNELFPPIATGLILSAVLAAIMSTASSQLLVAASAFAAGLLPHAAAQGRRAEGTRLDLTRECPRHREPRHLPRAQPEQLHP